MGESRYNVNGFEGLVVLKQFNTYPDGKSYVGVAGKVSIQRDKDLVGFEVRGGDTANWALRVDGPSGSVTILGCQVRMVHQFDREIPDDLDPLFYRVP
jgi:hypothetical protein